MTEAKYIIAFSVIAILVSAMPVTDASANKKAHAGLINRPAFAGKQSLESQYAELQDRWEGIKNKK